MDFVIRGKEKKKNNHIYCILHETFGIPDFKLNFIVSTQ